MEPHEVQTTGSQEIQVSPRSSSTFIHNETFARVGSLVDASSASHTGTLILPDEIYPTSPTYTRRYKHDRKREDKDSSYPIRPGRITFKDEELPPGWQKSIHPEGLPFFYRLPSDDCPMRIFTDEWLYDREIADRLSDFLNQIQHAIAIHNAVVHPNSDVVLELQMEGDIQKCGYYFVYHPAKAIYWLEDVNLEYVSKQFMVEIRGDIANSQVEICMELEYWAYWDCFPNLQELTPEIYDYAVSTIMGAITDVISSHDSTITASYEYLKQMLDVTRHSQGCKASKWHIGRFLRYIVGDRMRNYYGAYGARISRSQKVLESDGLEGHSKFFWLFSPFLFFIPHAQLERVKPLSVDRHIIVLHWVKFFEELQDEWNQTMMLATIMLAANCAFLAIPLFQVSGPSSPEDLTAHSTPPQVASYFSLVTSLYGFILSMVMYRQQKVRKPDTADQILDYIFNNSGSGIRSRLKHLVLIWSLPHALVTWSVVTFLLAFLMMCFTGSLTSTKILIALSTTLLSSLVFYYIIRFGSGKKLRIAWSQHVSRVAVRFKARIQSSDNGGNEKAIDSCSSTVISQV